MKRLVVLGGGESGVGTAILGKQKGFAVFVSDKGKVKEKYANILNEQNIEFESEKHSLDKIFIADLVMKSPGIPDTIPLVLKLKSMGIPVISEIDIAFTPVKCFESLLKYFSK